MEIKELEVTIPVNGTLSQAIDIGPFSLCGIMVPAGWTAAPITFQSSQDGTDFASILDNLGDEYTAVVGTTPPYKILIPVLDLLSCRWLKLQSGPSSSPVDQTEAVTLTLIVAKLS